MIKIPTFSRPKQLLNSIKSFSENAQNKENIHFIVTIDNNDILTISSVSTPSFGSVQIVAGILGNPQHLLYIPDGSTTGNTQFTYTIIDEFGLINQLPLTEPAPVANTGRNTNNGSSNRGGR